MRVLCLSANLELAQLRRAVLALHGVEVDIARSKKEAEALLEKPYDAALLCHTISEKTAERVVALFRGKNPGCCLIFLARSPWQDSPVKAEITHCALDGPDGLIEAVLACQSRSSSASPARH
jgi:DNA-binding response OmpR family regulator